MPRPVSLGARWVFPVASPPIEGGWVTVDDGQIVAVGPAPEPGAEHLELGEAALLPGLINAHAHLEFSLLDMPLGQAGQRLPDWIREVIAYRRNSGVDRRAAVAAGIVESRRRGVVAIGEIATGDWQFSWYLPAIECETLPRLTLFHESIGLAAEAVAEKRCEAQERLAMQGDAAPSSIILGLSPHAPYTVSPALLRELAKLAASHRAPLAMHLAESPEELELLATGTGPFRDLLAGAGINDLSMIPRGATAGDYLRMLLATDPAADAGPRVLAIHGNYLSPEEIEFAGQHRARLSVVYCPRTHAYFGHAPYPLHRMRAAGVRVVLGTDGRSSNPDLCILSEMRHAAAQHGLPPADALAMITRDAAYALGCETELGTLEPGRRAAFCQLRLPPRASTVRDPHELLLDELTAVAEPQLPASED